MKTGALDGARNIGIVVSERIRKGPDRPAETPFQVLARTHNFEFAILVRRHVGE